MTAISQKTIYLVGGQKGGVGKTSTCLALCQYMLDTKPKGSFTLIEGDAQIDDVGRAYGDQIEQTKKVVISDDPAKASNPDVIYTTAIESDRDVVVNLPSNILDVLGAWLEKGQVIDILKEKLSGRIRIVKLFVSDGCYESIRQLEKSISMLDNSVPHIVILNEGRVSAADFSYLEDEELYQSIRKAPNFVGSVSFPALEPGTRFFVDKHGEGLRKALEQSEEDSKFLRAKRIESFINDVHSLFDDAMQLIEKWFSEQSDWFTSETTEEKDKSSQNASRRKARTEAPGAA